MTAEALHDGERESPTPDDKVIALKALYESMYGPQIQARSVAVIVSEAVQSDPEFSGDGMDRVTRASYLGARWQGFLRFALEHEAAEWPPQSSGPEVFISTLEHPLVTDFLRLQNLGEDPSVARSLETIFGESDAKDDGGRA